MSKGEFQAINGSIHEGAATLEMEAAMAEARGLIGAADAETFDHFAELPVKAEAQAFAPLYDRIIIERDPEEVLAQPGGKIVTPEAWRQKTVSGKIIDAGMGARDVMQAHGVRIGDRIMWARYAGIMGQEGQVRTDVKIPYRTMDVCALMVKDILFDFDLHIRLQSGEQVIALGSDGLHFIKDKE